MPRLFIQLISFIALFSISHLYAQHTILVAPRDTEARTNGEQLATEYEEITFSRSFHSALGTAADYLNAGESVIVKVASGSYDGKAGQGVWNLPKVVAPNASLQLTGGWNGDFSIQDPFRQPTWLVTTTGRPDALISISGKSHLAELIIDGFIMDAQHSNRYDSRSGNLSKSGSRELPLIRFSYLLTDHLQLSNNAFMNAALGTFDPQIYPASNATTIDIENNFFINNVLCIPKLGAFEYRGNIVSSINLVQNTFLSNWPLNYSSTSSNVSAIMLYHSGGAQQIVMNGNIFAYHAGGALQHDWKEDRMPPMEISNNLFYDNAKLFEKGEDFGVMVGKFGPNGRYLILDMETLEEDFDYDSRGNVVADPGISLDMYRENNSANAYAPATNFMPEQLPLPKNEDLKQYGVQVN